MDVPKLFDKASDAFQKKNYDYAIDLFQQILNIEPDHVKARQALLVSVRKKYEGKGFPPKPIAILKNLVSIGKIAIAKLKGDYHTVMNEAQKCLLVDPLSVGMRFNVAYAAQMNDYVDTAIAMYESVLELDAQNFEALKSLGELYAKKDDVKKGQEYYQQALRIRPTDRECAKAVKDLAAVETMQEGRWEEAGSYRIKLKDEETADALEKEGHIILSDDAIEQGIRKIKEQLAANPDDARLYKKLGDLYYRKKDLENARVAFEKACAIDKTDAGARAKVGDIKIAQFDEQISALSASVRDDPENKAIQERLQSLKRQKLAFQIEEFRRRVKEHPTDMGLRFQLGTFLFAAGSLDEAISEFQQSVKDPRKKQESHNYLGLAFMKKNMFDLSIAQFERALEGQILMNEKAKTIHYNLGMVYEKKGDYRKALAQYQKIFEVDINFKDVAKRVESLRQQCQKE